MVSITTRRSLTTSVLNFIRFPSWSTRSRSWSRTVVGLTSASSGASAVWCCSGEWAKPEGGIPITLARRQMTAKLADALGICPLLSARLPPGGGGREAFALPFQLENGGAQRAYAPVLVVRDGRGHPGRKLPHGAEVVHQRGPGHIPPRPAQAFLQELGPGIGHELERSVL